MAMIDEKCAAKCGRTLAANNTNPDRICGKCQQVLKRGTAKYEAWKREGKPALADLLKKMPIKPRPRRTKAEIAAEKRAAREAARAARSTVGASVTRATADKVEVVTLPPAWELPLDYLVECAAELRAREATARKFLADLRKFRG